MPSTASRSETLPRRIIADFTVRVDDGIPKAVVVVELDDEVARRVFGDPLDDNAIDDDGYRFHDVIHLAHFAHLGWSPTVRALLGRKRRSVPHIDRVEDGARAIAIEEALCALAYGLREGGSPTPLPPAGLAALRQLTSGLEIADAPDGAWQTAYAEAFAAMAHLHHANGGRVIADTRARTMSVVRAS